MILRIEFTVVDGIRKGEEEIEHWMVCDACGIKKPIFSYPKISHAGWVFDKGPAVSWHFCSHNCQKSRLPERVRDLLVNSGPQKKEELSGVKG